VNFLRDNPIESFSIRRISTLLTVCLKKRGKSISDAANLEPKALHPAVVKPLSITPCATHRKNRYIDRSAVVGKHTANYAMRKRSAAAATLQRMWFLHTLREPSASTAAKRSLRNARGLRPVRDYRGDLRGKQQFTSPRSAGGQRLVAAWPILRRNAAATPR